jgi:hypothetical protein
MVPREDIYFALECKRLNVVGPTGVRSYASEYVMHGMLRFIRGQYASVVRHGGMLAYVLDRRIDGAIENVSTAIRERYADLGMAPTDALCESSARTEDLRCKETRHARQHATELFSIHHIFVAPVELN